MIAGKSNYNFIRSTICFSHCADQALIMSDSKNIHQSDSQILQQLQSSFINRI